MQVRRIAHGQYARDPLIHEADKVQEAWALDALLDGCALDGGQEKLGTPALRIDGEEVRDAFGSGR
jgi:hypothetical protein